MCLGVRLPYDDRATLIAALEKDAPHFATIGEAPVHADTAAATWGGIGETGALDSTPVTGAISDFYLTNPIARASETMAKCSLEFVSGASKMAAE